MKNKPFSELESDRVAALADVDAQVKQEEDAARRRKVKFEAEIAEKRNAIEAELRAEIRSRRTALRRDAIRGFRPLVVAFAEEPSRKNALAFVEPIKALKERAQFELGGGHVLRMLSLAFCHVVVEKRPSAMHAFLQERAFYSSNNIGADSFPEAEGKIHDALRYANEVAIASAIENLERVANRVGCTPCVEVPRADRRWRALLDADENEQAQLAAEEAEEQRASVEAACLAAVKHQAELEKTWWQRKQPEPPSAA